MFGNKKEIKIENKNGSFILNTFLKLTSKTYPYGFEDDLVTEMIQCGLFPKDLQKDNHGNYFYKIGESKTVFASHFDTACKDSTSVIHVIEGDIIKTDGKTILGADDKAGVAVMLYMIKNNIPGLYYFFIGEEVGCVGSGLASRYGDFKGKYDRMISFDRRGTGSVITHQSSVRCCSDEFANQLAKELNKSGLKYETDDNGIYTDSAEFVDVIPECTNLSVGYYREHTHTEIQNIKHLEKLAQACLLVNWENLVTKRDMTKTEYKFWSWNPNRTSGWRDRDWNSSKYGEYDDFYDEEFPNRYKKTRRGRNKKTKHRHFFDNGSELIDFNDKDSCYKLQISKSSNLKTSNYDWIMSKFLDELLTFDELEIVKDQYLDMDVENDRMLYKYLAECISEHGQ